jgi:rhodanese-related sulfurtransferase
MTIFDIDKYHMGYVAWILLWSSQRRESAMPSWIGALVLVAIVAAYILWSRRPVKGVTQISASALQDRLKQPGAIEIIDVREPGEFASGHIAKAKNIPLGQLQSKLTKFQKDKPVVFVCRSGNRSMMASKMAQKTGLTEIYNLTGGMMRWSGAVKR